MKSFQAEHDVINLIYYVAYRHNSVITTDDKGINRVCTYVRLRMVDREYYYVKGLDKCIEVLIELERDTTQLIDDFKYAVNSYIGTTPLQLTQFEIDVMNNVEV